MALQRCAYLYPRSSIPYPYGTIIWPGNDAFFIRAIGYWGYRICMATKRRDYLYPRSSIPYPYDIAIWPRSDAFPISTISSWVYRIAVLNLFKKGIFKETIPKFLEMCLPYYHISKRKYLERKVTYKSFTTVLRQICNANKITYTSQIKYDKSSYNIVYYIYL